MSRRGLRPRLALTFAVVAASVLDAQPALVTLPLSDPAYAQLAHAALHGCAAADISPFRPFRMRDVRAAIARARDADACDQRLITALHARFGPSDSVPAWSAGASLTARVTAGGELEAWPMWRDLQRREDGTPPAVANLRGRLTWSEGDRLAAVSEAYAQTHSRNDPRVRGRPFRTSTGVLDFSEAYIAARLGSLVTSLGRSHEAWLGERDGVESLILSAHGPPIDRLTFDVSLAGGRVTGRSVMASLDRVELTPAQDAVTELRVARRALVAHALSWRPTPALEFVFGETAILTRESRGIDLAYANPLMIYLVTEHDAARTSEDDRNNLAAFGTARIRWAGATLDAELLVDDIQIDGADREVTPDQLGWRLAAARPVAGPLSVGLEYGRVSSYTYIRQDYSTVYQTYGQPLGSELGPDADRLRGQADLWLAPRARVRVGATRWRRGAQRLDQRPGASAYGHAGEPFPSVTTDRPVVQSSNGVDITAQWLDVMLPITVRLELAQVSNVNNQPGPTRTLARAQVAGSFNVRYP